MFAGEMGPKYLQPVFFKVEKLYMKLGNVFLYHGDKYLCKVYNKDTRTSFTCLNCWLWASMCSQWTAKIELNSAGRTDYKTALFDSLLASWLPANKNLTRVSNMGKL